MECMSRMEFDQLFSSPNIKILRETHDLPKIAEMGDNIIKVFKQKRNWFSSDRRKPYALRFCHNSQKLQTKGIASPTINTIKYCPPLKAYVITYLKILGKEVFELTDENPNILYAAGEFVAELHQKGIFFRSIHLKNIIYQNEGQFALLDLGDVRFKNRSLNLILRYRNLKHLFKSKVDREIWRKFGIRNFLMHYCKHSDLPRWSQKILLFLFSNFTNPVNGYKT